MTNRNARNLPQIFKDFKGINCLCEEKTSETYSDSQGEATAKALDEFCERIRCQEEGRYLYQQIVFKE